MTKDHIYSREDERRCKAATSKGMRCRNKATLYRVYEGDHLEYLCCKLHFQYFRPHPKQKGQKPPQEEM
jgi:hypothetical protein